MWDASVSERYLCVVGDPTTAGGEALSGAVGFDLQCTDGTMRPVVRVGDPVLCGQCGPTTITTGVPLFWVSGPNVAADGADLACGHKLIAKWQRGFSIVDGAPSSKKAEVRGSPAQYTSPVPATRYSAQFVVRDGKGDPIPDFAYVLVDSVGNEYRGRTNDGGETQRHFCSIFTRLDLYRDDVGQGNEQQVEQVCREC